MSNAGSKQEVSPREAIAGFRWGFVALGIVLILAGLISIAAPFVTTLATKILLGWTFVFSGIAHIVHGFSAKEWKGMLGEFAIGLCYLGGGIWLALFPLAGIVALTIFVAAMLVIEGISKAIIAVRIRPDEGWIYMLVSGIVAFLAGFLIFNGLPGSAAWAIGLIVGVNLLVSGIVFLMIAFGIRKAN